MRGIFKKQAANANTPDPVERISSETRETLKVDIAGILGDNPEGEPYAEIFEIEFDEPHLVSFEAGTQPAVGGQVDKDKFRVYVNFDLAETGKTGERAVLVAHNMPRERLEAAFGKWKSMDLDTDKSSDVSYDFVPDYNWDEIPV